MATFLATAGFFFIYVPLIAIWVVGWKDFKKEIKNWF